MNQKSTTIIPSVGRLVHFVLPDGQHRPAIIVHVWADAPHAGTCVQLQVFVDGSNDARRVHPFEADMDPHPAVVWRTSVMQDADTHAPGTWHAPETVAQPAAAMAESPAQLAAGPLQVCAAKAGELCQAIEAIPPSAQQTAASLQAEFLAQRLRILAGI